MGSWEASKSDKPREVIAHFSASKLVMTTAGISGFAVLGAVMAWDLIFVRPTDDRIKYGLDIWGFAIFFVGMALLFFYLFRMVRAAIESRGIALWLQDGRLMHADKRLLDVPAREASLGTRLQQAGALYPVFVQ